MGTVADTFSCFCLIELLEIRINLSSEGVAEAAPINLIHTTSSSIQPRYGPGATSLGTKVYVSGGIDAATERPIPGVDIFDSSTNLWSTRIIRSTNAADNAVSAGNKVIFTGNQTDRKSVV